MRYLLSEIYLNATETEDACGAEEDACSAEEDVCSAEEDVCGAEEDVDAETVYVGGEMKIGFRWCDPS